jgi:hypothetical protein
MKWWLVFVLVFTPALLPAQSGSAPLPGDALTSTNYFPLWQKGRTNLVDLVLTYSDKLTACSSSQ